MRREGFDAWKAELLEAQRRRCWPRPPNGETWVYVVDAETGRLQEVLELGKSYCGGWDGYCGGCDDCLLMQTHYANSQAEERGEAKPWETVCSSDIWGA